MEFKYFAYGSNLDQEAMKERCPDSKPLETGFLRGYRLGFTFDSAGWNGGVADITQDPSREVWGFVYEISDQDLKSLDEYEGYPTAYTRFKTRIHTPSKILDDVWVYTVVRKKGFVPPTQAYLGIIQKAAKAFNFPENYRKLLDGVETS